MTPGKMVYEIQPKLDWTDEDAFEAPKGTGIGVLVGDPDDPELAGRRTAAEFVLTSVKEVERFLRTLAR